MKKVVCICSYCRKQKCMVHGVEQPGKLVDPSTRSAHEKRDRRPSSPSLGRHRRQSSPKTKSREGKHNKGKGNNLNRMPFSSHPWVGLEFLLPGSAKPTIEKLVCGIVIWLYIRVGVSRSGRKLSSAGHTLSRHHHYFIAGCCTVRPRHQHEATGHPNSARRSLCVQTIFL